MPKTGSSTMDAIFEHEMIKNKIWYDLHPNITSRRNMLLFLSLNSTYWGNFPNHISDVEHIVRHFHPTSKYRIIAGHFAFPSTDPKSWGVSSIEYMNTARNCVDREKSTLFYGLLDSISAQERIKSGKQQEYLDSLGIGNPTICFQDENCTSKFMHRKFKSTTINTYFCGKCVENFGYANRTEGSIDRLFNPNARGGGYVGIGITDNLKESLELLKCALPSYFREKVDVMAGVLQKVGTMPHIKYPILERYFAKICKEDDIVNEHLHDRFQRTLQYIRENPKCCRVAKFDDTLANVTIGEIGE
jgi:hypothetical protein